MLSGGRQPADRGGVSLLASEAVALTRSQVVSIFVCGAGWGTLCRGEASPAPSPRP